MTDKPKILIVDDNQNNRLAVRTVLKGVDAEMREAGNGFDALSMALGEEYALILLDVQMPEMDGYEVCEQLRADPRTANTPVIFLTAAYKEAVDKMRGYVAGATDYLAKPIEDHILKAKVQVFLRMNHQQQLLQEVYEAQQRSERELKEAQRIAHVGCWSWDVASGANHYWSDEQCRIFGHEPGTINPSHDLFFQALHPEDRAGVKEALDAALGGYAPCSIECRILLPDGTVRHIHCRGEVERDAAGKPAHMVGAVLDITERKLAEAELCIAAAAFESEEAMLVADAGGMILRVNGAFTNITGYKPEEVIGKNPRVLASGRHDAGFYAAMWKSIHGAGHWGGEIWNRRKNGEIYPAHITITAVKGKDGIVSNYVAALTDTSSSVAAADEIRNLAFYDPLTSLPNRRLLLDRLKHGLASSARSGRKGALLFIDLDNFKTLNDTLGHGIGDMLLQQVAGRLESCVREGDTVARLGGDEFVVMLEDLSEQATEAATQAEAAGEKILIALSQTYQLAAHKYHSTPSIGVAIFSDHGQNEDELLRQADIAMYQAKKAGRNTLRFFDQQMQDIISASAALESDLRHAITGGEQLLLYYQAQADSSGSLIGVEALVRWLHPERGMVQPAEFIPLAEETRLVLPLGHWVLTTACRQLVAWAARPETAHLNMAVNISAKQFSMPTFVEEILMLVDHFGVNPARLKLEITESMLLDNVDDIIAKMTALKAKGIGFSLDDFGTGYSSLQYLKRLPLDQLKIDQSFVRDFATDTNGRAIVRTIIAMAQSMNLSVIAEGVETEEQRQLLLNHGCTQYQGYLFGKPVPIEQFEAMLKQR